MKGTISECCWIGDINPFEPVRQLQANHFGRRRFWTPGARDISVDRAANSG